MTMSKIKHSATGPNGEKFKRVSASRRYSHCIIGRPSYAEALRRALDAQTNRNDLSYWEFMQKRADGTYQFDSYISQSIRDRAMAEGKQFIAENPDRDAYARQLQEEREARVKKAKDEGFYDRFEAIGWASRLDLAQKAAAQAMTGRYYLETRYVDAEIAE
jgi:hypothetical protein